MALYDFNLSKQEYTEAFYELMLSVMSAGGGTMDVSAPRLSLIASVKLKIDELQPQKEGVQFINTTNDTNILDMYINGLLDESAKHILQTAPIHVLVPTSGYDATLVPKGSEDFGHIILPDDYLRLVELKMDTWLQGVSIPITTTDPKYKKQKYSATRGKTAKPVVVLNSVRRVNAAAEKQEDTLTLSGGGGRGTIYCAGLGRPVPLNSPAGAVTAFVADWAADYLAEGVVVTEESSAVLNFKANIAGVPFNSPFMVTLEGDLVGTVDHIQENVPLYESKRVLEYYSVAEGFPHNIDELMYIANVGAEHIQSDLTDALTWLCASKVLQVMGNVTGQGAAAEKAMAQVELSYKNLI